MFLSQIPPRSDAGQVDAEAASLAAFLLFLGVVMKEIKTRYAATLQLYIGLWWNSVTRTLELEPSKLAAYLQVFDAVATAHTLTLRDAQSLAGKMQRCALTFPPGAECVFASLYAFMRGLVLPWQKRRVSRGLRADVAWGGRHVACQFGQGLFQLRSISVVTTSVDGCFEIATLHRWGLRAGYWPILLVPIRYVSVTQTDR